MFAHIPQTAQSWILKMPPDEPLASCHIKLGKSGKAKKASRKGKSAVSDAWSQSISAATLAPDGSLWIATDEHSQLLRLARSGDDYVLKGVFPLEAFLDLSDGGKGEIDIEGLACDGHWLWVTGSHSRKLKMPPSASASDLEAVPKSLKLANAKTPASRRLLARIPLSDEGISQRVKLKKKEKLTAAMLPVVRGESELTEALKLDAHIGPFISAGIPCKANGFDIEGLASVGGKIYLGLRGPVIDDWAMLLEIEPIAKSGGRLGLTPISSKGAPYRKIFLKLDGLGIRDLTMHGDTLYILAGPSMSLDGPVRVYAIHKFAKAAQKKAITLEPILHLPFGWKTDHPEAIVVVPGPKQDRLLVICDSPGDDRLKKSGAIRCELYALPK
jgi:Protein of unknown function (DUF3616)